MPTTAYLDTADATLTVVNPRAKTLRTFQVPPQIVASHAGRQAAWARNVLRHAGFEPTQTAEPYPYGIAVPIEP